MSTRSETDKRVFITRSKSQCWLEGLILGLGLPAMSMGISKLITLLVPAALDGSQAQRFFLHISGGLVVEWFLVVAVWLVLRRRGHSFRDLGVWRAGKWVAWLVALALAALSIASNLRFLRQMHIPISYAFFPPGFHLYAALALGITAGFCEEVLFRAFLMTEFAEAGCGKAMQVIAPGLAFGLAHMGYTNQSLLAGIGIMLPTAVVGMMWGVAYLLGRRSLLPCIVAHFLNDSTALPWIIFFMATGSPQLPVRDCSLRHDVCPYGEETRTIEDRVR